MVKKVLVDEIGEITLKKIKNARRISLKVKQTGEVLVTMPLVASYREALDFAKQQKDWILNIHQKVKLNQQNHFITPAQNSGYPFFNIAFKPWTFPKLKVQYASSVLTLFYPQGLAVENAEIQKLLKTAIRNILKLEAKKRLPQMLENLAKKHHFTYAKLTIRTSATRWGSCSSQKNINLSVYLMLLPDELIEYVILHELCHTLEMNHGAGFYRIMDRVTSGRTQVLRKQIKMEGVKWNFLKQNTEVE